MIRNFWLCCWLICWNAGWLVAQDRPNIVLILADDLGYETLGCYGGHSYATPHLNQLAAEGLRFDRAYAMPLCTNTRIQLMTGFYNLRNWKSFGILDSQARTFGHALQELGYSTCMVGKWQLTSYDPPDYPGAHLRRGTGMRVEDSGFDEYSLWHTGHTESKGSRYANPVIEQNGQLRRDTEGKYGPDLWTDYLLDFMYRHRDEPFFAYYSMALPHNPMNPTPDSPQWQDVTQRDLDETRFAKDMIEYTDKMVGKIRSGLRELGIDKNTLLLFVSDNGTNVRVRSKFRGRTVGGEKGKATELGCRVPMLASWPGRIEAGRVTDALIDSVDFLPTLMEVAGATPPRQIDGQSFLPILSGTGSSTRDYVLIHQDPRPGWDKDRFFLARAAIGRRFKLYEDGGLIDLQEDFFEERTRWPGGDTEAARRARLRLEDVLARYRDFRNFDPASVPREDPRLKYRDYAFQSITGDYVIVEAEQLPFQRDESWRIETRAPDFLGSGYLRCIRDNEQASREADSPGRVKVVVNMESQGEFHAALRLRSDTAHRGASLRFRQAEHEWQVVEVEASDCGLWQWHPIGPFSLKEGRTTFELAPTSRNLKVDRIVFFRQNVAERAMALTTACSEFHPW